MESALNLLEARNNTLSNSTDTVGLRSPHCHPHPPLIPRSIPQLASIVSESQSEDDSSKGDRRDTLDFIMNDEEEDNELERMLADIP